MPTALPWNGARTIGNQVCRRVTIFMPAFLCSSLQQQIAAANEPGGSGAPQGVSAEELTAKLGTLQASASTTAFEAQQAAADIFNEGDPASAEALEGLSPNQAVLMLQAARVWLTPDQQAQIDIAIQQIITGTEPAATTGEDDS